MRENGFAPILVIVLIVVAIGVIFFYQKQLKPVSQQPQPIPVPVSKNDASRSAETASWKTYTNAVSKYSVKYPQTYDYREIPIKLIDSESKKNILSYSSFSDVYLQNPNFIKEGTTETPNGYPLIIAYKANGKTLSQRVDGFKNKLKKNDIVSEQQVNISSVPATEITANGPYVGSKYVIVFVLNNQIIYEISYINSNVSSRTEAFNSMLSTFKFLDQNSNIADWKTYTDKRFNTSLKYPNQYALETTNKSQNQLASVNLLKNTQYTSGGGQSGSDVLKNGVVISIIHFPAKSLTEKDLKSEFGNDIKIQRVLIDQKQGTEIKMPTSQQKRLYFPIDNGVIEISIGLGFENSADENQQYISDFDQILSTFKFTN